MLLLNLIFKAQGGPVQPHLKCFTAYLFSVRFKFRGALMHLHCCECMSLHTLISIKIKFSYTHSEPVPSQGLLQTHTHAHTYSETLLNISTRYIVNQKIKTHLIWKNKHLYLSVIMPCFWFDHRPATLLYLFSCSVDN